MSVCKNATRLVLPFLNHNVNHKVSPAWQIISRTKYHSACAVKYNSFAKSNDLLIPCRSLFTTSRLNKITSFKLSDIGEGIREVIIKEWFVKEGDTVAQFDNICEVQSDKASVTITSRYEGIVKKIYHSVDDIALVGHPLIDIEESELSEEDEAIVVKEEEMKKYTAPILIDKNTDNYNVAKFKANRGFAIPSVRRIAKENMINLTDVQGMGKDGRILKDDILNYIKNLSAHTSSKNDVFEIEPVRGYRRTMIKTMTEAMKVPHFVYHEEILVTNLVNLREKLRCKKMDSNVKITYLPFFLKAVSNALARFPILNSRLDKTAEHILYNKSHNIAIAMDTPGGLAVPVIKCVQDKSILEISKEINRLQNLGKQMKFVLDDLSDGTFTFSNIGAIGGTYAKPIILPPQSAILALGSFQRLPRIINNSQIMFENIAYLSGAADHRIIDGATMAKFCNIIKQQIEEPYFLLLNI